MTNEEIIRAEAKDFYEWQMGREDEVINEVDKIKNRLSSLYSAEFKAIFLDELNQIVSKNLQDHRNDAHNGEPNPGCAIEIKTEKLLFYLNQEMSILPKIAKNTNARESSHMRNKVFVSYSHLNKSYLNDIKRHFKPFLKEIDFWHDENIQPGAKWKTEIRNAIDQTKVAILLLSTDFLGSEFISTDELPPLLQAAEKDGATILIVILEPCLFEEFPNLNQYQAMNPPSNPVIKMEYSEKEELYVNLVRQTKKLLK
ncbi:toll/interleukin-1 receptor domain-containing protein [Flagellimonas nanhaiensis]|uniref:Toll/interleukin-1 receptor domain-containing protein n=1 Tax=Flagellimonas nanhaiensis TaxID=2292706 RepID=A0A371JMH0_9FLAO|nr:toll/interleukin-1 receptor domain-containing protein [Allomuricauda nanhaiensis]RDY58340.1 toll/interleukin-1 receptor domain-containing protein [Allomuricauda nanhaiensis]